jgi:hypothetical protein
MLPLKRFVDALMAYKAEVDQNFDELIMAADLIAKKTNTITREDNGAFHIQVTGTLDECINTLTVMLHKLKKTKEQQE